MSDNHLVKVRIVDNDGDVLAIASDGSITATVPAGDLEIGAVELKNPSTDDRAAVATPANTADTAIALGVYSPLVAVAPLATFARPSDTNAYAALDAVSNSTSAPAVMTFSAAARRNGTGGKILKAQIFTDQKTNVARFRLHLFNTAPTAINDNSPYLHLFANAAIRVGAVDFAACGTEDPTNSTGAYSQNTTILLPYLCAAADTALYGLLETLDAFTPASGQNFTVKLYTELN